jgi:hypothetical protein
MLLSYSRASNQKFKTDDCCFTLIHVYLSRSFVTWSSFLNRTVIGDFNYVTLDILWDIEHLREEKKKPSNFNRSEGKKCWWALVIFCNDASLSPIHRTPTTVVEERYSRLRSCSMQPSEQREMDMLLACLHACSIRILWNSYTEGILHAVELREYPQFVSWNMQ